MTVIGIDPGGQGALAQYDALTGVLDVVDMPTYAVLVGKKSRQRVDGVELLNYFEMQKLFGVRLAMIEAVGGRPGQANMFQFGFGVGVLWMACIASRVPMETVEPGVWKKVMKVPGKGKGLDGLRAQQDMILRRAYDLFPDYKHVFHGPKGGRRIDRCEAALIAYYAAHYALNSVHDTKLSDLERYKAVNL